MSALGFISGFVDTLGFIALFNLFAAHITGNVVLEVHFDPRDVVNVPNHENKIRVCRYQVVGEIGPDELGALGVVVGPPMPASQNRPSMRNRFCISLSNVDDSPVLVE